MLLWRLCFSIINIYQIERPFSYHEYGLPTFLRTIAQNESIHQSPSGTSRNQITNGCRVSIIVFVKIHIMLLTPTQNNAMTNPYSGAGHDRVTKICALLGGLYYGPIERWVGTSYPGTLSRRQNAPLKYLTPP